MSFPVSLIALISMNYEGLVDLTNLFLVFLLSFAGLAILDLLRSDGEESNV